MGKWRGNHKIDFLMNPMPRLLFSGQVLTHRCLSRHSNPPKDRVLILSSVSVTSNVEHDQTGVLHLEYMILRVLQTQRVINLTCSNELFKTHSGTTRPVILALCLARLKTFALLAMTLKRREMEDYWGRIISLSCKENGRYSTSPCLLTWIIATRRCGNCSFSLFMYRSCHSPSRNDPCTSTFLPWFREAMVTSSVIYLPRPKDTNTHMRVVK